MVKDIKVGQFLYATWDDGRAWGIDYIMKRDKDKFTTIGYEVFEDEFHKQSEYRIDLSKLEQGYYERLATDKDFRKIIKTAFKFPAL
jgi:hypothetical protein